MGVAETHFVGLPDVVPLPNGRLFVADSAARRVLLLDARLALIGVLADSTGQGTVCSPRVLFSLRFVVIPSSSMIRERMHFSP
jgi:hypothetical protein